MIEVFSVLMFALLLHLPCLLALGACGLGFRLCGVKHRTKFIFTSVLLVGLYAGAHYYEHFEGEPTQSPNYFFCGS